MRSSEGWSHFDLFAGKQDLNRAGMNDSPVGCQNRGD